MHFSTSDLICRYNSWAFSLSLNSCLLPSQHIWSTIQWNLLALIILSKSYKLSMTPTLVKLIISYQSELVLEIGHSDWLNLCYAFWGLNTRGDQWTYLLFLSVFQSSNRTCLEILVKFPNDAYFDFPPHHLLQSCHHSNMISLKRKAEKERKGNSK